MVQILCHDRPRLEGDDKICFGEGDLKSDCLLKVCSRGRCYCRNSRITRCSFSSLMRVNSFMPSFLIVSARSKGSLS
jgi:hypothetical protein